MLIAQQYRAPYIVMDTFTLYCSIYYWISISRYTIWHYSSLKAALAA